MKEMGDSENEANSLKFWVGWLYLLRKLHHMRTYMATDEMLMLMSRNSQGYFQEVFNFSASALDKQLQY